MDVCGRFKTALFEQEPRKFTVNKAIFWAVLISLQLALYLGGSVWVKDVFF